MGMRIFIYVVVLMAGAAVGINAIRYLSGDPVAYLATLTSVVCSFISMMYFEPRP